MSILNIAGYKFIELTQLNDLRQIFLDECISLSLKGTILLSKEGLNVTLAGSCHNARAFISFLKKDIRFTDIRFHETYSDFIPYQRLKIKLKKEIISLRQPEINAVGTRAPYISPETFKEWMDENRDITILDTRNDYEVNLGTFEKAVHLSIKDFSDFPSHLSAIDCQKPIVMFCTGGIRCEKAALYLIKKGMTAVHQLDGGILGYFSKMGGAHFQGDCFVFDDRITITPPNEKSKN